jgi:hypothetical protein
MATGPQLAVPHHRGSRSQRRLLHYSQTQRRWQRRCQAGPAVAAPLRQLRRSRWQ